MLGGFQFERLELVFDAGQGVDVCRLNGLRRDFCRDGRYFSGVFLRDFRVGHGCSPKNCNPILGLNRGFQEAFQKSLPRR